MSNFDRDCNTYNEEGKILQLEYAAKAVEGAEYSLLYLGPSSESSASMASSWAQRSWSSLNSLLRVPTEGYIMSMRKWASLSAGRSPMADISWTMQGMRLRSMPRSLIIQSLGSPWLIDSDCTRMPTLSTTQSDPSVPPRSSALTTSTMVWDSTWLSTLVSNTGTLHALQVRVDRS